MKKTNFSKYKIGAVVIAIILLGSMLILPSTMSFSMKTKSNVRDLKKVSPDFNPTSVDEGEPIRYDRYYVPDEDVSLAGEQNDIGYNCDVGDTIIRSLPIYVGEPVDETIPGRGRTGELDPNSGDDYDWYRFTACEGQQIQASCNNFDIQIYSMSDPETPQGQTFTADQTGQFFVGITGSNSNSYTLDVTLSNQNDAGTGSDAGDSIGSASSISPGDYSGYLSSSDVEDWYSFSASSGQGIFVTLESVELREGDFDVHLYNPSGDLVHSAMYYGEDNLEYPADSSGTWKIKIDMFPGWDQSKWPDDYFLYGSGSYTLSLSVGGSAESPPGPIPQPDIIPVAQTFIVTDDPNSNKDEYAYISAIPAANYMKNGDRYVSPIVYTGVNDKTNWFGTVDDTTDYLLEDWNTYLSRHGKTAEIINLDSDPIKAAANIAKSKWSSSDTAVLSVDGSNFEDTIETIIDASTSLDSRTSITTLEPSNEDLHSDLGKIMWIGDKWGAIAIDAYDVTIGYGDDPCTSIANILPQFLAFGSDWWPTPYDGEGEAVDLIHPITVPGIWSAATTLSESEFSSYKITKIAGDRYTIPISSTDSSIKVKIESNEATPLVIFLVDPEGNVRRPNVPHWNGGDVNPLHYWNGGHWQHDFDEFRSWEPEISKVHTEEVNYPMKGKWTAIVVPISEEDAGETYSYDIKVEVRKHNSKRNAAALSAANAAVIASLENAPLLYVKEDSIPSETSSALSQLGVSNIIFVNIDDVSSATPSGSVIEYNNLQAVIDEIKSHTENVITITSLGTGDGYFAPAAMIAAYHDSPVLNIGEVPDVYNTLDMLSAWREYAGDYYHGCNAVGHPPKMSEPFDLVDFIRGLLNKEVPDLGFDLHKRSYTTIHDGIVDLVSSYGLDSSGKEAYIFVSPRDSDIRTPICRAMTGIESYAGHIPEETPAFASAHICRDILYPVIIYANPGRDVTSSCFVNFADGRDWTTNDGERTLVYTTRSMKRSMFSHGRFYEGHCLWEPLLERYNEGCSILYHCSHGTGGSGICCLYGNIDEQFPLAEPRHENLKDFDWWNSWRGYTYDDSQTKTARWGGFTWVNAQEPNLYDIVHFKWCDQLFDNLHSQFNLWQSCTTGEHFGPMIYLEHGAALWYGNAETGLCPQEELFDEQWFTDMMENGLSIGESLSNWVWLHQRDYTAREGSQERDLSMYGSSSMTIDNCQVLYGDPTMVPYSPEWTEPTPVNP